MQASTANGLSLLPQVLCAKWVGFSYRGITSTLPNLMGISLLVTLHFIVIPISPGLESTIPLIASELDHLARGGCFRGNLGVT